MVDENLDEENSDYLKIIAEELIKTNELKTQEIELIKINTEANVSFIRMLNNYVSTWDNETIQDAVIEKLDNLENKLDNFVIGNNIDTIRNLDPVEWKSGVEYKIGDQVIYNDNIYIVVQNHTSQDNWTPDAYHTGFVLIATPKDIEDVEDGKCPKFTQPTAQTVYNQGDCVVFNGKTYISLINGNGWSPEEYPAGWKLV